MSELIIIVLFGLGLGYFATENTLSVPISLATYHFNGVPLYLIAFVSLLAGLLMAWIIHVIESLSFWMSLRSKDTKIKERDVEMEELRGRLQGLEVENARLRTNGKVVLPEEQAFQNPKNARPNFFQRIRNNFSFQAFSHQP